MLKHKDMKRTEWSSILEKEYRCTSFANDEHSGVVSVLLIKKVTAPMVIKRPKGDISIAKEGDIWLQIAAENSFVWITAMYDCKRSLQQIYFDITNGNNLNNSENPTFEDLFLDIVLDDEGEIMLLDQEELEDACASGNITIEQFQSACNAGRNLCNYLCNHKRDLLNFCFDKLTELD